MIFNTLGRSSQGSALGVYSALVGLATTLGSFVSGFTSFYFGFHVTFIIAAICLAAAAGLTSLLGTGEVRDETPYLAKN
jgi:MFS family permease